MSGLLIILGLAAWAAFFLWRVHVEDGWVGISPFRRAMLRITVGIRLVEVALGETLLPTLRRATERMSKWSRQIAS